MQQRSAIFLAVSLFAVAFAAGCVGQAPQAGVGDIAVRAIADPPQIRPYESMTLFIDVENVGQLDVKNLAVDLFDAGLLSVAEGPGPLPWHPCVKEFPELRHAQVESLECKLTFTNPELLIKSVTPVELAIRTTFTKNISSTVAIEMLSLDELRRLERIGRLEPKPQSYTFGDGQLQATLQFQRQPPFLAGDTVIAQLSVRNVGPGYIGTLEPRNFLISQSDPSGRIFTCAFDAPLYSYNGIFPPITCILAVPSEIPTAATYPITLVLGYDYELRQSVPVSIAKP
ncbi:MAG: hypothetical protein QW548_02455 [Candidatus Aenigmatarchaeota archaeon]